ncbi:radical SAM protein [Dyadobacter sp. LJ53]|uniref:radical SAM/SPASM domain-containing protein n=1 Tax=Dyadobacter chenwenxiniae TaxID=2906456 RepID=UPI001F29416A|nr:radical SAM protein [Dyadobacter chenwenxiniae]MCF0049559.1 radical SAM protein [Dyadobacter chenwenxiniae]
MLRQIDQHHAFAVNCSSPHSLRVLNSTQSQILKRINGKDDLADISAEISIDPDCLESFMLAMAKSEIIRFDDDFSTPQKPEKATSLNFWIHTTDACNLGCSYCYISTLNKGRAMTEAVKNQLLQKLLDTAVKRKIKHVKLRLAGGEPLAQFQSWKAFILEARHILGAVGCKLDFAFITNLTILSQEIVDFSFQHSITFGISLDGIGSVHDLSRKFRSGSGSFDVVNDNLLRLIDAGIPVSVTTVVNNANLKGLPDLTQYLIKLNLPFRYSIVKGESIDAEGLEKNLSQSFLLMEEAIKSGWQFSRRFQFCDLKPSELGFQTCASGFSGGAIYTDGSLKYCHVHFGDNNQPSHSIFDNDLDLIDMIAEGVHPEDDRSEDCHKCRYRFVCTSGCPVYRVDQKDPQCSIYHHFIPFYYELQAKERLKLLRDYKKID